MRALLVSVVLLSTVGCPKDPVPPVPDADAASDPVPDAASPPTTTDASTPSCATWCAHATELKCPAGRLSPSGATCATVCINTLDGPAAFNVACRTKAKTCDEADQCENDASFALAPDGGIGDAARPSTCAGWCSNAAALRCPSGKPTPLGATCVQVCTNVQTGPAKWNLKCRAAAKTCKAADACEH